MSRWNGRMGKGAGRAVRDAKREEAAERQADFRAEVKAHAENTGVDYDTARQNVMAAHQSRYL